MKNETPTSDDLLQIALLDHERYASEGLHWLSRSAGIEALQRMGWLISTHPNGIHVRLRRADNDDTFTGSVSDAVTMALAKW